MDSDDTLDKEYENLNNAILQAIVASEDVQSVLARFKDQHQMDDKTVLNLFLSLEELHQMINEKSSGLAGYKLEPSTHSQATNKTEKPALGEESIIDGEILTLNEVLFEKFFQETFDESKWMKKARIHF